MTLSELRQWVVDQTENEPEVRKSLLSTLDLYDAVRSVAAETGHLEAARAHQRGALGLVEMALYDLSQSESADAGES